METSVAYWNRIARRYAKQPIANEAEYQNKLEITRRYLKPHMKVLEFGCGTGSTALIHGPRVQEYMAIDLAPNMIEIANEKLQESGLSNLHFQVAKLEDFSSQREIYDVILGLNILHLLKQKEKAIELVYQLLKPGGVFVSSTACLKQGLNPFRLVAPFTRIFRLPMINVFSRGELEQCLIRQGFKLDNQWVPKHSPLVYFIVAVKPN